MPEKFARVWSRRDGDGYVLDASPVDKTITVMWNSGHESVVQLKDIQLGGRPKK